MNSFALDRRSVAWFSVLVLAAVVLALGLSSYLSSPDRAYLFDGERGMTRPEMAFWWRVRVPLVFALGAIASGLLIVMLRATRRRAWLEAVSGISVALLGIGAVTGSLHFIRQQADTKPIECERTTPRAPREVFLSSQWHALSTTPKPGTASQRLGPRRENGVGLKDHPGLIPFDPFLLDRLSFVGLTLDEVESLLGPPVPPRFGDLPHIMYSMSDLRGRQGARLYLSTGSRWERFDTVQGEHLRLLPRPN